MRRKIGLLFVLSLVFFTTGVFGAEVLLFPEEEGVIISEVNSGDIIYQQKQDEKFYPASTTKLMTALVAIENGTLAETVTVGEEIEDIDDDSSVAGLEVYEVISLEDLLYGLLLPSGNDAANTISVNIGRKIAGNSTLDASAATEIFIEAMNKKAKDLDMKSTHFVNPHGLHSSEHYSTPGDMLKLAEAALNNDVIRKITRAKSYKLQTDKVKHEWTNSNLMLYPNYDVLPEDVRTLNDLAGVNPVFNGYATSGKTGYTEEAGKCLIFEGEGEGKNIIGIIMNADKIGIFEEANKTLNTLIKEYDFIKWTGEDDFFSDVDIENYHVFDGKTLGVKTNGSVVSLAPKDSKASYITRIKWDDNLVRETDTGTQLQADISEGETLGEVEVYNGEVLLESNPVYAVNKMNVRGFLDYPILYWYVTIVVLILTIAILRIIYVDFMRKNRIKYKKIKIKKKN
ncbi:D-alanyl-D-alanine carboxypeptidase family protein [Acetobacterium bakii]|uniref:D-alanyl-D-alanine carboxypeptidase family protein n=1 Tax=Acetobacterium bakii TaxID=52689 RepID=UPI000682CE24|nr:D-alanyl-D-alanine carboxypeptidase [Acetobacterium bakii]